MRPYEKAHILAFTKAIFIKFTDEVHVDIMKLKGFPFIALKLFF